MVTEYTNCYMNAEGNYCGGRRLLRVGQGERKTIGDKANKNKSCIKTP